MTPGSTRRHFLEMTGATVGMAGLGSTPAPSLRENETPPQELSSTARPKIAAIATVYHYLSHAYHIVGRFIDGFIVHDGNGLHKPPFEIAGLFIEQTPAATDLGRAKVRGQGIRLSPTIADALTLGTGKLAVDGVLLIAEHGDYPYNDKLQKLYPRGRFFREVLEVFQASGRAVPVFIDKHLSYSRAEAREMIERAKAQHVPLMAGSSLPVTWRLPPLEVPLGRTFKDVVVASRGDLEIFGFHALETLQCMVERRNRSGRTQGVASVTCLEGDAVWEAGEKGVWSWPVLEHALGRSHTRNVGDIKQNTRDYMPPPAPGRDALTKLRHPTAFVVEYVDGLRATVLILNGHVDDTTIAARIKDSAGDDTIVSTLMYLPAPPGASFFNPLVLRIEDFFRTGQPPYPVERTLLTGGILDVALESRIRDHRRIETPELATIDYQAPVDSGFIRSSLTSPEPNRL
ncbi:MAG: twin-arginine translocation signal domain-containing protein [Isosphaerales bacterium]